MCCCFFPVFCFPPITSMKRKGLAVGGQEKLIINQTSNSDFPLLTLALNFKHQLLSWIHVVSVLFVFTPLQVVSVLFVLTPLQVLISCMRSMMLYRFGSKDILSHYSLLPYFWLIFICLIPVSTHRMTLQLS